MAEVRDLDVLRPEKHFVKLNEVEIDVSFIPTGLTFDIDKVVLEMAQLDQKKIGKKGETEKEQLANDAETLKAFNLGIKLCAVFCSWKHPDMDVEWFEENTTALQVRGLGEEIRGALARAYEGIDSKN